MDGAPLLPPRGIINQPYGGGHQTTICNCCGLYRWLVVGLTALSVLVLFVQRINLSVAVIPWAAECNWDEAEQQRLLGAFFRGYLITMFPGAVLSTRLEAHSHGLVVILVLSSVASAATPLVADCDASTAVWLRLVMGAAQGPLFPLVSGIFGQWVLRTEYSRANAFLCEGSNLGVLLAFPVSSLLCRYYSYQQAFVLPALAAVPCVLLICVFSSTTPNSNRWIGAPEQQLLQAEKVARGATHATRCMRCAPARV
jgi:ACS family sodium-dependent inorganic phosphate cotransporter